MEPMNVNNPHDFAVYPTNRVCAIIDTAMDARSALDGLLRAGLQEQNIDIFYGSAGIEVLDAEGEHHGVAAKIAKKLRAYGDIENETMKRYEQAMIDGGYVFEVLVKDEEEKELVHHTFSLNNAHEINYFGSWYVEAMNEA
jgi:hypothetical protein